MVDLIEVRSGCYCHQDIIRKIATGVSVNGQVVGGIRSLPIIKKYLEAGVSRVIVGTAAITDTDFLKEAVDTYGEKIVVSLDARNGYVATDGWTDTSTVKALDLVKDLERIGLDTIVYTDIAKDGMLKGPNLKEQSEINQSTNMNVIASGGITTKQDVDNLAARHLYGAIIGKALYDGKINFESLMEGKSK